MENWTNDEKMMLYECVRERKSVIESKSGDVRIAKAKRQAWMDIEQVFRAHGYERNSVRIKEMWRRMKGNAKKTMSTYKRNQHRTGGGPPPETPENIDMCISELCYDDFQADTSFYDSDRTVCKNI